MLSGSIQDEAFVVAAVAGGDKTALASEIPVLLAHQAMDLQVLQDPATIPQRPAHAAPAIGYASLRLIIGSWQRR